jgi:hypothetical protein
VALFVVSTPYWMPFEWFGFEPLPWPLLLGMVGVALTYGLISELLKKRFYRQLL